ncbi:MAG: hypothetical protein ACHQ50_17240, partial [Fimbriimonadales bacterium]
MLKLALQPTGLAARQVAQLKARRASRTPKSIAGVVHIVRLLIFGVLWLLAPLAIADRFDDFVK